MQYMYFKILTQCLSQLLILSGDIETNPGPENGTDTREYRTIEKYIPQLEDEICQDTRKMAHFLLINGYLPRDMYESVTNPDSKYSESQKGRVLVHAVLRKVKLNSRNYNKFVDRLREDVYYQDIVELLDEEYKTLGATEDASISHEENMEQKPDLKNFVVQLESYWETCTSRELDQLKDQLIHKFFLPPTALKKGSSTIIWSLPVNNATSLKEDLQITDNGEFCNKYRIKSMSIDGKLCKYSPVQKYAAYLKNIYSHKKDNNLFAARIEKVKADKRKVDPFTRSTLRGDKDGVAYRKHPISEKEVGCPTHWTKYKEPKLVLIEGAPGVGKTTFSEQCCYRWSQGQSLQGHALLILLPLRDNRVKSAKNVRDLLLHLQLGKAIAEEVEGNGGEGVALWLEAWDELEKEKREESSVFLDLVHGQVLPNARIIITSRPWATKKLRENLHVKVDQHVEVVSTPKIQFSRLLRDRDRVGADIREYFIDYVSFNPAIKAAMHTPITANIVAEVFQWSWDKESPPPTTVTQLYAAFTCKLLMQHFSSEKIHCEQSPRMDSLEELPSSIEGDFKKMCRLAWEGILKQKLTFDSATVGGETLGLMYGVSELYDKQSCQLSYHFFHLTLQEFLSAYHYKEAPTR